MNRLENINDTFEWDGEDTPPLPKGYNYDSCKTVQPDYLVLIKKEEPNIYQWVKASDYPKNVSSLMKVAYKTDE